MSRRGVRYYRALPPPEREWQEDYPAVARAGFDFVVVPVAWTWSHLGDEAFDFSALLRQLDLARDHKLELVAAIDLTTAPPWLASAQPDCLHEAATGVQALPRATPDAPAGGWPGLCLDNSVARAQAGRFLRAAATALAKHPSLVGYDVSDYSALEALASAEPEHLFCQCAGSRARFVAWLRREYHEDIASLGQAWGRRYANWADIAPPAALGPFPDVLDWRRFQRENAAAQLRWCVEALREVDRERPIIAAGACLGGEAVVDSAALAREVTEWGCRLDAELPHEALDRVRGVAGGKHVSLTGFPADEASRARRANWSALGAGAQTLVYEAWRPEQRAASATRPALACPDGAPSERLAETQWFAQLLERHPDLAAARPDPPEVAIIVVEDSQAFWSASSAGGETYEAALRAAYDAFTARGARVELARPDALQAYPLAYLPLAPSMSGAGATALRRYVEAGGTLVAEACAARFDGRGLSNAASPGQGLTEVFGARAVDAPDVVPDDAGRSRPTFKGRRGKFPCYLHREPLEATTGKVKASFADGTAAIVDNTFGAGAARLIGTHPSLGLARTGERSYARVIVDSLPFAKVRPRVSSSSPAVCVRLLEHEGVHFLCVLNVTQAPQEATVTVRESVGKFRRALDLATGKGRRLRDNARRFKLGPGDGAVLRLESAPPRRRWRPRRKRRRPATE